MKNGDKFHQLDARGAIGWQGVALSDALPDGTVTAMFYSWLSGCESTGGTVNVKSDFLVIYNSDEAMAAHVGCIDALEDENDDLKSEVARLKALLASR